MPKQESNPGVYVAGSIAFAPAGGGPPSWSNYALWSPTPSSQFLISGTSATRRGPWALVMRLMGHRCKVRSRGDLDLTHPPKQCRQGPGDQQLRWQLEHLRDPFAVHNLYKVERGGHPHVTGWVVEKYRGSAGRKFDYVLNESEDCSTCCLRRSVSRQSCTPNYWRITLRTSAAELANVMNVEKKTLYNCWLTP